MNARSSWVRVGRSLKARPPDPGPLFRFGAVHQEQRVDSLSGRGVRANSPCIAARTTCSARSIHA